MPPNVRLLHWIDLIQGNYSVIKALTTLGLVGLPARNRSEVEEAYPDNALAAMPAGKEIANASTKALGCIIKFDD